MRLEGGFGMLDVSDPALHDGLVSPKERFGVNRSGDKDNDIDFSESKVLLRIPRSGLGWFMYKYIHYGPCAI